MKYTKFWRFQEVRKKIELLVLLLALAGIYTVSRNLEKYVQSDQVKSEQERKMDLVVIDSGHGGSDPGKIGLNNLLEKDINLAITKKVKKCLEKEKITAELTRKEDKGLGTTGDGSKKTEDMQARVKMINEMKPVLTVSIHQNSYEDPEIHGAQVFYYSHSREGEAVAKILQESLQEIDPENHRRAKANETYYLLRRTKVPTVIVECGFLTNPEEAEKLSGEEYQEQIAEYSSKGYRVLVFGEYEGTLTKKTLTEPVVPMGFVMLANPIRKGAKETFTYFAENEVEIKVISGDNPLTVSVIAKEAGIANAERYVDASVLKTKSDYYNAVEEYTVFGRVTPNQKRMLVQALKAHKKTVAMTGDGVNDVLALKDADCSVAMASGSDAASNVSQLVLLDSDFSRMPSVVAEGRRVVNNIERTAALYIVKNIFSMLLAVFSVILLLDYPLEPTQVSLISMFTIGIPSFILALEPNKNPIRGHFLTNVLVKALPAGLTDFIVVSGLVIFCREFSVDLDCLSTSCTILVAIVGFMILYRIAKPMNVGHIIMMIGVIAGWLFCMLFVSKFFAITSISKQCAMLMIVFAIITEPALRYLSAAVEWIYAKISGIRSCKAR